ncbi:hypothetical protein BH10PSE19_BH10PSE19_19940 [soil metagenome]
MPFIDKDFLMLGQAWLKRLVLTSFPTSWTKVHDFSEDSYIALGKHYYKFLGNKKIDSFPDNILDEFIRCYNPRIKTAESAIRYAAAATTALVEVTTSREAQQSSRSNSFFEAKIEAKINQAGFASAPLPAKDPSAQLINVREHLKKILRPPHEQMSQLYQVKTIASVLATHVGDNEAIAKMFILAIEHLQIVSPIILQNKYITFDGSDSFYTNLEELMTILRKTDAAGGKSGGLSVIRRMQGLICLVAPLTWRYLKNYASYEREETAPVTATIASSSSSASSSTAEAGTISASSSTSSGSMPALPPHMAELLSRHASCHSTSSASTSTTSTLTAPATSVDVPTPVSASAALSSSTSSSFGSH